MSTLHPTAGERADDEKKGHSHLTGCLCSRLVVPARYSLQTRPTKLPLR